jgi:hypothetical protein
MEVVESIVLAAEMLDLSSGVPIVEVSDSVSECMICRCGAIEEHIEPDGDWLSDVLR